MAVWIAEVFVLQELTLGARGMTPDGWLVTRDIRLTLDSIAIGALTVVLARPWLQTLFLMQGGAAIGLFVYYDFLPNHYRPQRCVISPAKAQRH